MAPDLVGKLLPARALDVRSASEFSKAPTLEATNIAVGELAARVYELPPVGTTVALYRTGDEAGEAAVFLAASGRVCEPIVPIRGQREENRYRLWSPPDFLAESTEGRPPARALCLACGVGREAVHLAALGWDVVAIDWLPDALERGKSLEARYAPPGAIPIHWIRHDLRCSLPEELGQFDLICELFSWQPATPDHFATSLTPGGIGLWEGFASRPEALAEWQGLRIVASSAGWREQRETKRVVLREARAGVR